MKKKNKQSIDLQQRTFITSDSASRVVVVLICTCHLTMSRTVEFHTSEHFKKNTELRVNKNSTIHSNLHWTNRKIMLLRRCLLEIFPHYLSSVFNIRLKR